jgi:hypothetical protein
MICKGSLEDQSNLSKGTAGSFFQARLGSPGGGLLRISGSVLLLMSKMWDVGEKFVHKDQNGRCVNGADA